MLETARAALWDADLGSSHAVVLRGTPGYGMPEVALDVRVAGRSNAELGRTLRLDAGPLSIAVSERSPLPIHPVYWRQLGLSARKADVIVQKNFFHYRIFYATTSFRHLPVVSEGATSLERVKSRRYQVPTYPGQSPEGWRPYDPVLRGLSFGAAA